MVKMKNRATKKQGRAFALAREARNLTQQQVAEAAGTNRPIVQRYEEGRSLPSDDGVLDRLHAVVGLSRRRRAPNEKGKRTGRLRRKVRQHKRDADSARAQKQADRADGRPTVATESSLFDGFPELQAEHRRVWAMWRGAYGAWVIAAWSLGALANKVERVRDEETVLRLAEEYGISKTTLYGYCVIARSIDLKTLEALINARSTPNKTFPIALAERLAKVPAEKQRMLVEKAEQARPSTSQLTRWIAEATSTREPHVRAEDVIKTRCDSVVNAVASLKKRTDGLNTILYRVGAVPSSRDDITLVVSALDGASDSMQVQSACSHQGLNAQFRETGITRTALVAKLRRRSFALRAVMSATRSLTSLMQSRS